MNGVDTWIDGYSFWRGQYSARNTKYISLVRNLVHRQHELADRSGDNLGWLEWLNTTNDADPVDFFSNSSDNSPISLQELQEIKSLRLELDRDFPYGSIPNNALNILYEISEESFPPPAGFWRPPSRQITPGFRSVAVYDKGINKNGFRMFAVDCGAEINTIISEIRNLVEKIKYIDSKKESYSDDTQALKNELCANGASYRINSDESRAIGLLLFDHAAKNGGSDADAIRWAKKELQERGPKTFGKADSSDRQFQRWLTNTRRCIEAAEVLEI